MRERYENLNGFRAIAAVFVILRHVIDNGQFVIEGYVWNRLVPAFTNFTFFFMLVSAFSLCCGYYESFRNNTVNLEQFYKRRYQKLWPYFALLCTIELIVNHDLASVYEWFADLTLAFGLLPNADISVVGVGWFIGTIFVFYMIFPFFVFLIRSRRRAWFVLGLAVIFHLLCQVYFFDEAHVVSGFRSRSNVVYSFMFFVAGGLIYLYRDEIKAFRSSWALGLVTAACTVFYFLVDRSDYTTLILFSALTMLGIRAKEKAFLSNRVIRFVGGLGMEIYLCHMFVFRLIEKLGLVHVTGNETVNYALVSIATVCGAILVAFCLKNALDLFTKKLRGLRAGRA